MENCKNHYLVAIFASCIIDGERGAKTALRLLNKLPARPPSDMLDIFDAIATAGNPASVGPLKELGEKSPDYRVSCAFAIRGIAPDRAVPIIKAWLADHKHVGMKETLSPAYWDRRSYSVEALLNAALQGKNPLTDDISK